MSNGARIMRPAVFILITAVIAGTAGYFLGHCQAEREGEALALAHALEKTSLCANALNTLDNVNGTPYFWRVRGINAVGAGPWSPVWSFTTALALPAAVTLVSPAQGAVLPTPGAKFQWLAGGAGVDGYTFELGKDSSFGLGCGLVVVVHDGLLPGRHVRAARRGRASDFE